MPWACASYGDLHCYFLRGYNRVHVVEFVMNGIVPHEYTANRLQAMYTMYGLLWIVWAGVSKKHIWNRGRCWNCTFCLTFSCCRNLYSTSKSKVFTWALIKHLSYFFICSGILVKHHDQKRLPTEKSEVCMFLSRNWELRIPMIYPVIWWGLDSHDNGSNHEHL